MLAVSCDSFKLAKCIVKTEIENKNDDKSALSFSFILPTKTVNELYKLLKDDERESVRIYMTRRNIVFNIGNLIFFSRLIEGQYIDYDRIIMRNHRIAVTCNRSTLISALERAALVTEDKVAGSVPSQVKLSFEGKVGMLTGSCRYSLIYCADGEIAIVGTVNLDYRSLSHHFECGAYLLDTPVLAHVEADFQETLKRCHRVTWQEAAHPGFWWRLGGMLMKAFAPLL